MIAIDVFSQFHSPRNVCLFVIDARPIEYNTFCHALKAQRLIEFQLIVHNNSEMRHLFDCFIYI